MRVLTRTGRRHPRARAGFLAVVWALVAASLTGVGAAPAEAASGLSGNSIFWTTPYAANLIYVGRLDGSTAATTLNTTGATVNAPWGLAPDPAAGKVYWANYRGNKISWARLDGSGGGDLATGAATVSGPSGVVVDHAHGKIYWANTSGNKISWARLNGSGGGDLNTGTATVNDPLGVAIDSAAGKIYWANYGGNKISFARLDNGGGGDLNITGTTVSSPWGVVIDSSRSRVYWGNFTTDALDYANLDGTGGGVLATTGASQAGPMPGSIDPATGRLYWANWNSPQGLLYAKADGTGGGGTLYPLAAQTAMPVILKKPAGTAVPVISGGSWTGAHLTCSKGRWGADLLGELLYRAPARYTYRWTKNGIPISGATANTFTPHSAGTYRCTVSAANAAGSTSQASAARAVWAPQPDAMIKSHSAATYLGNNVHNTTGRHQAVHAQARRFANVAFDIRVQNDAHHSDSFKMKGPSNKAGFTVQYLAGRRGTTDITFPVVHGTYALRNISARASKYLRLVVKVKAGASIGAIRAWLVMATSTHDTNRKDAVKAKVRVVSG